jgi:hypothetical protein
MKPRFNSDEFTIGFIDCHPFETTFDTHLGIHVQQGLATSTAPGISQLT